MFVIKYIIRIPLITVLISCATNKAKVYPKHWWREVPKKELQWWEIGPQVASKGEVILSKRNELGILSNFSHAPFKFEGKQYPNVEALWQSMKYPETKNDIRSKHKGWPHSRAQVEKMDGFAAKTAGDYGSKMMKRLKIDWVTFKGEKFVYRTAHRGRHYQIIRAAMLEKLKQNKKVKEVLLSTGDLTLRPDHHTRVTDPPAWKYYQIWMELRRQLLNQEHKDQQQEYHKRDWDASRRM